jgi:hypothetical protein
VTIHDPVARLYDAVHGHRAFLIMTNCPASKVSIEWTSDPDARFLVLVGDEVVTEEIGASTAQAATRARHSFVAWSERELARMERQACGTLEVAS